MDGRPEESASAHVVERWQHRLINREAAVRIFDAAGGEKFGIAPNLQPHREALYLTLGKLITDINQGLSKPVWTTPAQAKRIEKAWKAFTRSIAVCSAQRDPPPTPPQQWVDELEKWSAVRVTSFLGTGRPPSSFNMFALPPLLALFALAFDRTPSAASGPTQRFVQAAITQARAALSSRGRSTRHLPLPSAEALKKAIPGHLRDHSRQQSDRNIRQLFEKVKAELASGAAGKKGRQ